MENSVSGIHHITAITDEPQRNLDFYVGILGLRFVKKTVNFDAPDTYHLYYGDNLGQPGTILTFFSWPGYPKGHRGTGQATAIAFSIPATALSYWQERLTHHNIAFTGPAPRFSEQVISLNDPDGLGLELVAHTGAELGSAWQHGPIPMAYAIHGFHSVTLSVARQAATASVLTDLLGYQLLDQAGERIRYALNTPGMATRVDLLNLSQERRGLEAIGSVHHVAWRSANDTEQLAWRSKLTEAGLSVTPVLDRTYFHSIYFREPGGVLFEIATDQPGFSIDELPEELGTHLKLPPWLEEERAQITQRLPTITPPEIVAYNSHDSSDSSR